MSGPNHNQADQTRRLHHKSCLLYDVNPNLTSGLHQSRDCRCPKVERHDCGHVERVRGCGGCDPGAIEFVRDDFGPWRRVNAAEAARWRGGCTCYGGPHGGYTCDRCAS